MNSGPEYTVRKRQPGDEWFQVRQDGLQIRVDVYALHIMGAENTLTEAHVGRFIFDLVSDTVCAADAECTASTDGLSFFYEAPSGDPLNLGWYVRGMSLLAAFAGEIGKLIESGDSFDLHYSEYDQAFARARDLAWDWTIIP